MTFFHCVELLQPGTSFICRAHENTPTASVCVFNSQMSFVCKWAEVVLTITSFSVWKIICWIKFGSWRVFLRCKTLNAHPPPVGKNRMITEQLQQKRPHAGSPRFSPISSFPWSPSTSKPSIVASSTDMPSPFPSQGRLVFEILSKWCCGRDPFTCFPTPYPLCSAPPN